MLGCLEQVNTREDHSSGEYSYHLHVKFASFLGISALVGVQSLTHEELRPTRRLLFLRRSKGKNITLIMVLGPTKDTQSLIFL